MDISKCEGESRGKNIKVCPLRFKCYRFTSQRGIRESWMDMAYDFKKKKCSMYWKDTNYREHKEERGAGLFMERIKDNPNEIIAWCKREIEEYKKLIKLIEGKNN